MPATPPSSAAAARDARAARTGAALRAGLLSLLDRKPFEQITVREICANAGVHYATFFRHHATKEALLDDLAAEQIEAIVGFTLPIWEANSDRSAFRALCAYVDEHRALWSVLLNGGAGPAMREEWLSRARLVATVTEPKGSWLPVELGTICSVGLIAETISWWLRQPATAYSVDEIAAILCRLVTTSTLAGDQADGLV